MTGSQITRILEGMGISTLENVKLDKIYKIIMSQNFYSFSYRDLFTFDVENELIKIKRLNNGQPVSNREFDIVFDMSNVVGIESRSSDSMRY